MLLKHGVKEGVNENGSDEEETPRMWRGPAASWDEVQAEPVWTEAGIVEVRPQGAAVHTTVPLAGWKPGYPEARQRAWHLAGFC